MSPTDKLIERLRKGLDGVTPGPWYHYNAPLRHGMGTINEIQCEEEEPIVQWAGFDNSMRTKAGHKRNAAHIARCSPDNIRALLDTIARLEEELREKEEQRRFADDAGRQAFEKLVAATAQLEALRVALEPFGYAADHLLMENGWSDTDEITLSYDDSERLAIIPLSAFRRARTLSTGDAGS